MKVGDLVYVPHIKQYGYIHELNWEKKRIKSVRTIDPVTGAEKIIEVLGYLVEAVSLVEKFIDLAGRVIKSLFSKRKKDGTNV